MSSFNKVNNFEISIEKIEDVINVVHLVIKINSFDYFRFPYYTSNIYDLIKSFKDIIEGKIKTISLNFNYNYNLMTFEKDRIMISLLNDKVSGTTNFVQEFRIFFENNSIVRNSLRQFIEDNN